MRSRFRRLFKGGVTGIPREVERAFFFYATLVFIGLYALRSFF
jgi:hypothetical protein